MATPPVVTTGTLAVAATPPADARLRVLGPGTGRRAHRVALTAALLGGMLTSSACAQPPAAPAPTQAAARDTPDSRPAPRPEPSTAPLPPVDPRALDPDALDPAVRACIPQNEFTADFDFYETGRASDGADVYVALEWWEQLTPDAAFDLHPALLRFRGGACEVLIEPQYGVEEIDQSALVPAAALAELDAETLAWKIAVAGGPDAYEAHLRRRDFPLAECRGEPDGECVYPARAALLRRAGIDVLPPAAY